MTINKTNSKLRKTSYAGYDYLFTVSCFIDNEELSTYDHDMNALAYDVESTIKEIFDCDEVSFARQYNDFFGLSIKVHCLKEKGGE